MSVQQGRMHRGPQLPYKLLAGVEPVPGGWLVAPGKLVGVQLHPEEPRVVETFREVLDNIPAYTVVAAHVPIALPSLPAPGGRTCDREARRLLGFPRMGAIPSAPAQGTLEAVKNYGKAAARNGGRLDVLTFRLLPKIAEVAGEVQPYHQRMLYEVQPELAFYQLNEDQPLRHPKRSVLGVEEREALLRRRVHGTGHVLDASLPRVRKQHLVDACADLWVARRIAAKAAARLPEDPEWNDEGLRMEILR